MRTIVRCCSIRTRPDRRRRRRFPSSSTRRRRPPPEDLESIPAKPRRPSPRRGTAPNAVPPPSLPNRPRSIRPSARARQWRTPARIVDERRGIGPWPSSELLPIRGSPPPFSSLSIVSTIRRLRFDDRRIDSTRAGGRSKIPRPSPVRCDGAASIVACIRGGIIRTIPFLPTPKRRFREVRENLPVPIRSRRERRGGIGRGGGTD
mmetsp:Transcript_53934/g.161423  ORF Transcript_53934/g.161423 Transcript_53934/m.161423 type:complete len:205 (-) Transcript_53934:671-1285(-)